LLRVLKELFQLKSNILLSFTKPFYETRVV
jgi:hypothetical protein